MNRLSLSETIGQGFNWQVAQWPYLIAGEDVVAVLGEGTGTYWFDRVDDTFVARFGVKRTLELVLHFPLILPLLERKGVEERLLSLAV